jgi:hypothetical protein
MKTPKYLTRASSKMFDTVEEALELKFNGEIPQKYLDQIPFLKWGSAEGFEGREEAAYFYEGGSYPNGNPRVFPIFKIF